ncbi:unnamed protein product, partial [Rotaria sp. Silwood1]
MSTEDKNSASCVFFKGSVRRRNAVIASLKRRQDSSSSSDENQPSVQTFCSSRPIKKCLIAATSNNSSNKHRQHNIDNDADEDYNTKESLSVITYKSDRQVQLQGSKDIGAATSTIENNLLDTA